MIIISAKQYESIRNLLERVFDIPLELKGKTITLNNMQVNYDVTTIPKFVTTVKHILTIKDMFSLSLKVRFPLTKSRDVQYSCQLKIKNKDLDEHKIFDIITNMDKHVQAYIKNYNAAQTKSINIEKHFVELF